MLQGERPMAAQNRTLGKFKLGGIPPAPRGVPQIEVTFDIDANGILNVTAKDNATGKDTRITITSSSGLSKEEVEKMAKEAEAHASEDKEKREEIEAHNALDGLVYNIEKMLKDSGDKVAAADKTEVEAALADAKKTLEGSPSDGRVEVRARQADPRQPQTGRGALQGQRDASGSQGRAPGGAGGADPRTKQKKDEGVIDAEYVDVDDKK